MGLFKYLFIILMVALPCLSFAGNWPIEDMPNIKVSPDYTLLFFGGLFVILMQMGFAMIEGGYDPDTKRLRVFVINYMAAIAGNLAYIAVIYCYELWFTGELIFFKAPLQTWHLNLFAFYVLMTTTVTMVVSRIIPKKISLIQYWWISFFISFAIFSTTSRSAWGGVMSYNGLLKSLGFVDFAGSTVVHSMAAWIVLAGYVVFGKQQQASLRRKDIIFNDYKILAAGLAGFVLWLSWSSLNVAYITAIQVDIQDVVLNTISTLIAAIIAMIILVKFNQQSMTLEGLIKAGLGGLVAITASCALVSITAAIFIGFVAGILVFVLPNLLKRWIGVKNIVDVTVIHGICGVWGTLILAFVDHSKLAAGRDATLFAQLSGVIIVFVWSFGLAFLMFKLVYWWNSKRKIQLENNDSV